MNKSRFPVFSLRRCIVVFCLFLAVTLRAQLPGGGTASGTFDPALLQLFGDIKAFTATAQARVTNDKHEEIISTPMKFALLDRAIRVDLDLTKIKTKTMPAGAAEQLKAMGMANVVSITRPEKKTSYVLYPDQKVMLAVPVSKDDVEAADKKPKIEKTEMGKETVEGHPCIKRHVIITPKKGDKTEATTWNATDLKDFPVQIETKDKDNQVVMTFRQVQLVRPDAKQFEIPTDYTSYNSQQELFLGLMKRAVSGTPQKPGTP